MEQRAPNAFILSNNSKMPQSLNSQTNNEIVGLLSGTNTVKATEKNFNMTHGFNNIKRPINAQAEDFIFSASHDGRINEAYNAELVRSNNLNQNIASSNDGNKLAHINSGSTILDFVNVGPQIQNKT